MTLERLATRVETASTWIGKTSAWLIILLTVTVCVEVVKRYILDMPTAWVFDVSNMMYGTLFMMCGAYALAHDGHVRGDFLYGSMKPRKQAAIDLVLYIVFFLPGILALTWAGWNYANDALAIRETTFNATPLPVWPFKFIIPIAGACVLVQGLSEILRCILCLKTGSWPERLKDAEEIDVVEQQLASSTYVDEAAKREVMAKAKAIDEAARQRMEQE
jgi:TRAP-type mannitol/chloroaromatic compound transport system permease small subunit